MMIEKQDTTTADVHTYSQWGWRETGMNYINWPLLCIEISRLSQCRAYVYTLREDQKDLISELLHYASNNNAVHSFQFILNFFSSSYEREILQNWLIIMNGCWALEQSWAILSITQFPPNSSPSSARDDGHMNRHFWNWLIMLESHVQFSEEVQYEGK